MHAPAKINLIINYGASFIQQFRWESHVKEYIPIDYIYRSAPVCILVNDASKLPPLGWRIQISDVIGMRQINMEPDIYENITSIEDNAITISNINSINYYDYQYGGIISFNKPIELDNITARMQIRKTILSNDIICNLTTENGMLEIEKEYKSITIRIPDTETRKMNFTTGVYDLEFIYNNNDVYRFAEGSITLRQ